MDAVARPWTRQFWDEFWDDLEVSLKSHRHADYLLVKDDEGSLLDYLDTLVAKEYAVYNNPRPPAEASRTCR